MTTRSPARSVLPKAWATRLSEAVAPAVNTISSGAAASTAAISESRSTRSPASGSTNGRCSANQGRFYDRFDHVVLLTAPIEVLLARVEARTDNPFGSTEEQRDKIRRDTEQVVPLLRRGTTLELDATRPAADHLAELLPLLRP